MGQTMVVGWRVQGVAVEDQGGDGACLALVLVVGKGVLALEQRAVVLMRLLSCCLTWGV